MCWAMLLIQFNTHKNSVKWFPLLSPFSKCGKQAQRSSLICPRSYSEKVAILDRISGSLTLTSNLDVKILNPAQDTQHQSGLARSCCSNTQCQNLSGITDNSLFLLHATHLEQGGEYDSLRSLIETGDRVSSCCMLLQSWRQEKQWQYFHPASHILLLLLFYLPKLRQWGNGI